MFTNDVYKVHRTKLSQSSAAGHMRQFANQTSTNSTLSVTKYAAVWIFSNVRRRIGIGTIHVAIFGRRLQQLQLV